MQKLLMIPGPCDIEEDVLLQMSRQVVCHYGKEWVIIYNKTRDMLKNLLNTSGDVFIINGSGHLSVEAMLVALGEYEEEIAIVDNGFFAHRMIEILETYGLKPKVLKIEWGKSVLPEQVENFLNTHRKVKALGIVHSETSTGVLNPLEDIASVTRQKGVYLAVDAVSSAGIIPIDMDGWGIDFCATASQKGLGAPPGLAILAVSKRALEYIRNRKKPIPGWYANLQIWDRFNIEQAQFQPYSISLAVNLVFALQQSLENIIEEGVEERYKKHKKLSDVLKTGVKACGLDIFSEISESSPVITVMKFPEFIDSANFVDYLRENYNILIANGLGNLKGKVARIGHMGKNANITNIIIILLGLESFLRKNGMKIQIGATIKNIV